MTSSIFRLNQAFERAFDLVLNHEKFKDEAKDDDFDRACRFFESYLETDYEIILEATRTDLSLRSDMLTIYRAMQEAHGYLKASGAFFLGFNFFLFYSTQGGFFSNIASKPVSQNGILFSALCLGTASLVFENIKKIYGIPKSDPFKDLLLRCDRAISKYVTETPDLEPRIKVRETGLLFRLKQIKEAFTLEI